MSAAALTLTGIVKPVVSKLAKKFSGAVVERWTRYRAERFFDAFVNALGAELGSGVETDEVDGRIDEMFADENKSEVLFDAYRRVCFATSKNLGPRVIGLLTGRLVHEGRMADESEQCIFAAAEMLSDGDFIEFMKSYQEHRKKAEGITDFKAEHRMAGDSVIVQWCKETTEHSWPGGGGAVDIGSLDFNEALGGWATKLKLCGLLADRIQHQFTGSRMADTDFKTHVTTTITFHSACAQLYDLLSRSLGPSGSEASVN